MRGVLVLLLLLQVLAARTPALAAGIEYRVEIEAPAELAEPLRKGLNLVRWQGDPQMTPELLRRLADEAERDAREVAAAKGYFAPQVRVAIDEQSQPWRVLLQLEPGERTTIAAVDIRFSGPVTNDDQARDALERVRTSWGLPRGQPFRQDDWERAKRQAVRELARWRYAGARLGESEAQIDPGTRQARLSVELQSGPAYRFGPVQVSGVKRYPAQIVENMNPARPGDDYDRDLLVVYQRRLVETGYFASVQAEIDTQAASAAAAPLRVAVVEGQSKNVETGVSYNTDSAWRLRSGLSVDRKKQEVQLDLDSPPRRNARWNNFFSSASRSDIQNEVTRAFALGVAHNFGTDLANSAAILSWHLEDQSIGESVTDSRHAVYLGLRRGFRSTDDVIAPRVGYFGSVEVGGGLPSVSTQDFLRAIGKASLLIPVGRDGDLLLRAQAGAVRADTRQGIPSTFLFRTGGDQTVRGYAYESLGVREGNAIVGGRRLFVASIEYTHWFAAEWGIAAFVDAGDAWDDGERFRAALGYGLGARLRTPIGPARIDLAYGEDVREFRLHLSVGYVF
ncbi:MAG: autotransporter assembly complex family protein [Burkholderiales bacterium]